MVFQKLNIMVIWQVVHGSVQHTLSRIPQFDGPIPDPYDDVLSTPNVSLISAASIVICIVISSPHHHYETIFCNYLWTILCPCRHLVCSRWSLCCVMTLCWKFSLIWIANTFPCINSCCLQSYDVGISINLFSYFYFYWVLTLIIPILY